LCQYHLTYNLVVSASREKASSAFSVDNFLQDNSKSHDYSKSASKRSNIDMDARSNIIDMREFDVTYYQRVLIDRSIRCDYLSLLIDLLGDY
jgi:hypothetical protein